MVFFLPADRSVAFSTPGALFIMFSLPRPAIISPCVSSDRLRRSSAISEPAVTEKATFGCCSCGFSRRSSSSLSEKEFRRKRSPRLRWWLSAADQVFAHAGIADAELQ